MNEHTKHFSLNTWQGGSIHTEAAALQRDPQFRGSSVRVELSRGGVPEIVIKPKPERLSSRGE